MFNFVLLIKGMHWVGKRREKNLFTPIFGIQTRWLVFWNRTLPGSLGFRIRIAERIEEIRRQKSTCGSSAARKQNL